MNDDSSNDVNTFDLWPFRFALILIGYGSVLAPGYLLIKWVKKWDHEHSRIHHQTTCFMAFLKQFALGKPELIGSTSLAQSQESKKALPHSFTRHLVQLLSLFAGIQLTLVTMGFFQERIMTQTYEQSDNDIESQFERDRFGDAQFLVLANRIVALIFAGIYLTLTNRKQPPHASPYYLYSFCSISNTLASWCQYEALKYVSFPTQTFCKSSKLVPTMLIGRIMRKEKLTRGECVTALLLLTGAAMFFYSTLIETHESVNTEQIFWVALSGFVLMAGYLVFDAFTPNWQKKLFEIKPKISRYQMMFGVNAFSAILCLVSLIEQGTFFNSLRFLATHNNITTDIFLLSVCSALSQFFIYAIVERFGPNILAIIMTIRQFVSILLSSTYFEHDINIVGMTGLLIAFAAICLNIYFNYRKRVIKSVN